MFDFVKCALVQGVAIEAFCPLIDSFTWGNRLRSSRSTESGYERQSVMLIGLHIVPPLISQMLLFSTAGVPAELLGQAQ